MIQLTRSRVLVLGPLEPLSEEFASNRCVKLPAFLDPDLLITVHRGVDGAEFHEDAHGEDGDLGHELGMARNEVFSLLRFVMNDRALFDAIERITDCGRIGSFTGRVYRVPVPGRKRYDQWHNDMGEDRLVGLSLNLSPRPYEGGTFRIRRRDDESTVREMPNTGFGDAILFRIAPELVHQISEVTGPISKTAFAGWFRARPDYQDAFRAARARVS